jgi:hypothetical protein
LLVKVHLSDSRLYRLTKSLIVRINGFLGDMGLAKHSHSAETHAEEATTIESIVGELVSDRP